MPHQAQSMEIKKNFQFLKNQTEFKKICTHQQKHLMKNLQIYLL